MKYWQIIADNLSEAGWSLGWVSALDLEGQTMWIVDAHAYGNRFVVHADEKLTAFLELERAFGGANLFSARAPEDDASHTVDCRRYKPDVPIISPRWRLKQIELPRCAANRDE